MNTLMFNLPYPVIETGFTQEQLTSIISRAVLIDIIILGVVSVVVMSIGHFCEQLVRNMRHRNHSKDHGREHVFIPHTYEGLELKLTASDLAGTKEEIEKIEGSLKRDRNYVVKIIVGDAEGNQKVIFTDFPNETFLLGSNFVVMSHGH